MLKVKVIAMGKSKEEWLRLALQEYEKRLSPQLTIDWVQPATANQLEQLLVQEKNYILLDPKGDLFDSFNFSQKIMHAFEELGSRLTFSIGPPEGFPSHLLQRAAHRWSLSPLTFTHQLTRLILIEQIYRALEIAKGSPYHK